MKGLWILTVLFALPLGCGKKQPPEEVAEGQPPAGWEPIGEQAGQPEQPGQPTEQQAEQAAAERAANLREAVARLRGSVGAIRVSQDAQHGEVANALRTLADALTLLPNAERVTGNVVNIDLYAERLASSDATSVEHADWTKAALTEVTGALTALAEVSETPTIAMTVQQARALIDGIDTARPLMDQRDDIAGAVERLTEVIESLGRAPTG